MKTKMMGVLGGLMLAVMLFTFPTNALAQLEVTGTINFIGQGPQGSTINLTGTTPVLPATTYAILNANAQRKEMLAIALTAMSTGKPVRLTFDPATLTVSRVFVNN